MKIEKGFSVLEILIVIAIILIIVAIAIPSFYNTANCERLEWREQPNYAVATCYEHADRVLGYVNKTDHETCRATINDGRDVGQEFIAEEQAKKYIANNAR